MDLWLYTQSGASVGYICDMIKIANFSIENILKLNGHYMDATNKQNSLI